MDREFSEQVSHKQRPAKDARRSCALELSALRNGSPREASMRWTSDL
jgi:hypothetical protein